MSAAHETKAVELAISIRRVFVAIELSKSTWVVAILAAYGGQGKSVSHPRKGTLKNCSCCLIRRDIEAARPMRFVLAMRLATTAFGYIALYRARRASTVLDFASIQVSR